MTDPADKDAEIAALKAEVARLSGPTEAIDATLDRLSAEYAVAALDLTPPQLDRCAAQLRNLMLMTAVVLAQPYKKRAEAAEARVKELEATASFLLERMAEVEREITDIEFSREYIGHVSPAASRLRALLSPKDKTNG